VKNAKQLIIDAVNCTGAICTVDEIVATLTVKFPGISSVHTYVKLPDGIDDSATGGSVDSRTFKTDETSLAVLRNHYDVRIVKGTNDYIYDDVDCTGETCVLDKSTLTVKFPGISSIHTYVRESDGVAGTATGTQVASQTFKTDEAVFSNLLNGVYDVVLVKGSKTKVVDDVIALGNWAMVDDIVATLTVKFPGISSVHTYVRVDDGIVDSATGGAVESRTWKTDETSMAVLKNTYDVVVVKGSKTKIIDAVDCTGAICTVDEIVATLTVKFPGISSVHTYVRVDDGIVDSATGGAVESRTWKTDETSMAVLKNTYDVVVVKGSKTKIIDAVDCTGAICAVDEIVATMTVYFPGLSGVHVYVRIPDGVNGTATGGSVESRTFQSESTDIVVLRNYYDVVIVKPSGTEIHDDVDCTSESCEVWDPSGLIVSIDIKPGSDPNSINLTSKGKTPVAVLTNDTFDATLIDPVSVLFAGASPVKWAVEDVDGDGDTDMIFHFKTQELELDGSSTEAELTGYVVGGLEFSGNDSVNIVPKAK